MRVGIQYIFLNMLPQKEAPFLRRSGVFDKGKGVYVLVSYYIPLRAFNLKIGIDLWYRIVDRIIAERNTSPFQHSSFIMHSFMFSCHSSLRNVWQGRFSLLTVEFRP